MQTRAILCKGLNIASNEIVPHSVKNKHIYLIKGKYYTVSMGEPAVNFGLWRGHLNQKQPSKKAKIWVSDTLEIKTNKTRTPFKTILSKTLNISLDDLYKCIVGSKTSKQVYLIKGKYYTVSKSKPNPDFYGWEEYVNQKYTSNAMVVWVSKKKGVK